MYVLFTYGIIWSVILYIIVTAAQCRRALRRDRLFKEAVLGRESARDDDQKAKDELYRHLIGYPVLLCVVSSWPSVRRLWLLARPQSEGEGGHLGGWAPTLELSLTSFLGALNCAYFLYANPLRRIAERHTEGVELGTARAGGCCGTVYDSTMGSVWPEGSSARSSSAPPSRRLLGLLAQGGAAERDIECEGRRRSRRLAPQHQQARRGHIRALHKTVIVARSTYTYPGYVTQPHRRRVSRHIGRVWSCCLVARKERSSGSATDRDTYRVVGPCPLQL